MAIPDKIPVDPDDEKQDKQWDNPVNPEAASDPRDTEQLERQKKEAELRKENLTDDGES